MRVVRLPLLSDRLSPAPGTPRGTVPTGLNGPRGSRERTEMLSRLSARRRREIAADSAAFEEADERPRTRGECRDGPRPCPWVGCRHHLAIDVLPTGNLGWVQRGKPIEQIEFSCALDLAEHGGLTLDQVAQIYGISRERVRQIEMRALQNARRSARALGFDEDDLFADGAGR